MREPLQEHTTCVTEHDKYAKGATKPGGYAASGFYGSEGLVKTPDASAAAGLEFLSMRPPWKCTICNVSCTSQETLMGHASGAKHKRRVSAISGALYHQPFIIGQMCQFWMAPLHFRGRCDWVQECHPASIGVP